jgi:hypothetical protein
MFTHYGADGAAASEAMPVIAMNASRVAERAALTVAIAQRLCALAERQIRAHPSQWSHWTFVRELLCGVRGATAELMSHGRSGRSRNEV